MGQVATIHCCVLLLLLGTSLASRDAFLQIFKEPVVTNIRDSSSRYLMQSGSGGGVSCRQTSLKAFVDGSFATATDTDTGDACSLGALSMVVRDTYRKGGEYRTHTYKLSGTLATSRGAGCDVKIDAATEAQITEILDTGFTKMLQEGTYQRRSTPFSPSDICTTTYCDSNQWIQQSTEITDVTYKETSCCATNNCNTGSAINVGNISGGKKKANAGAIAGGVIGGLAGLGIIAGVVFFFVRRNRNKTGAQHGAPSATGGDAIKEYDASKAAMGLPQQHYAGMSAQPVPAQQFYQPQGQQPVMMVPANNMQHQQMPMQHMPMQQR